MTSVLVKLTFTILSIDPHSHWHLVRYEAINSRVSSAVGNTLVR